MSRIFLPVMVPLRWPVGDRRFEELQERLGQRGAAPVAVRDEVEIARDRQAFETSAGHEPRPALVDHGAAGHQRHARRPPERPA